MTMDQTQHMLDRTRAYSLIILKLCSQIKHSAINLPLINQLVRSGTSVGANYRATRRAKSKADFIYKFKIVEEELDETLFFLDLLKEMNPQFESEISRIEDEGLQLLKIIVSSISKLKSN